MRRDERNKVEFSRNGSLICGVGQEDVTLVDMQQIAQVGATSKLLMMTVGTAGHTVAIERMSPCWIFESPYIPGHSSETRQTPQGF